jgi:aspartyl aminopeptidase
MSPLSPKDYEQPFIRFMTDNPTVFHAVNAFEADLTEAGFQKVKFIFSSFVTPNHGLFGFLIGPI